MLHRLRSEFQLSIIVLFAAGAAIGVLPLGVDRLLTGHVMAGLVDIFLVACMVLAAMYAWRTGDTRRAGWFIVAINMSLGIAMVHLVTHAGSFGMFTILLASFLLVDRRGAAVAAAFALAVVALDRNSFSSDSLRAAFVVNGALISLFAFLFAARTDRQRLQLEALATHDALTGLHNRREMEEELRIAVATNKRSGAGFGLVMLDLDHFKRINDTLGHQAGDQVLIAFADLLKRSTRKADRAFRYGGEEFVMIFPGVDLTGLRTVINHLRARIAAEMSRPEGQVTASIGAALLKRDEDERMWMMRVDAAMYQAKHEGRDRAVVDVAAIPVLAGVGA
jgi:diguanylate cyclase (GGDEF)-like protein